MPGRARDTSKAAAEAASLSAARAAVEAPPGGAGSTDSAARAASTGSRRPGRPSASAWPPSWSRGWSGSRARSARSAPRCCDRGGVLIPRVAASALVPGGVADAEALWYDRHRWPSWIDGFGHVAKLEGDWPRPGARLLWESRPGGRGLVSERVTAYEPGRGQTLDVEDERMESVQTVFFEPAGDSVRVTLALD